MSKKRKTPTRPPAPSLAVEAAAPATPVSAPRRTAPPGAMAGAAAPAGGGFWAGMTLLLASALAMRFFRLGAHGLWFDEIQTLTESTFLQPWGVSHDLFFRATRLFLPLAADPTVAVRIYPALCGSLAVVAVALAARRIHSSEAGWIAGALACLQPFQADFSREGRYYAPMMLFSAAAIFSWASFVEGTGRRRFAWLAPFAAALWLSVRNHPAAIPFAGAVLIAAAAGLILTDRGRSALATAVPRWRATMPRRATLFAPACVAGILAFALMPRLRGQVIGSLFHRDWGATPSVDFTFAFFAAHLSLFGLDFRGVPLPPSIGGVLNLLLLAGGLALLCRRSRHWAGFFAFVIAATFTAVFGYNSNQSYLFKYTAYLEPFCAILIALPLAGAARMAIARMGGARRTRIAALSASACLIAMLHFRGLGVIYTRSRVPIHPQFTWLNENVEAGADVFVYGHTAIQAALYRDRLAPRHRLRVLPWEFDSGRLEVKTLQGAAAAGRPVYFAKAWPWDMPEELTRWLPEKAKRVAQFPSLEADALDGLLYEIAPGDAFDPLNRPAASIGGFDPIGRPKVIQDGAGGWNWLEFKAQSAVEYAINLREVANPVIEIDVEPVAPGPYFLAASIDDNPPGILGGVFEGRRPHTLRARLSNRKPGATLHLRFASDYNADPQECALIVKAIRARPQEGGDQQFIGQVPLPPLHRTGYPVEVIEGRITGWKSQPEGTFALSVEPGAPIIKVRIAEIKAGTFASIRPYAEQVSAGQILQLRARGKFVEAYGLAATPCIHFFDAKGRTLQRVSISTPPMQCRIQWDPWLAPLQENQWNEFQSVIVAPPGTDSAAPGWIIWEPSGARRVTGGRNELQMLPFELSILSPPE